MHRLATILLGRPYLVCALFIVFVLLLSPGVR